MSLIFQLEIKVALGIEITDISDHGSQQRDIIGQFTALDVLALTRENGIALAPIVAEKARQFAQATLRDAPVSAEVMIVDRQGEILAHAT